MSCQANGQWKLESTSPAGVTPGFVTCVPVDCDNPGDTTGMDIKSVGCDGEEETTSTTDGAANEISTTTTTTTVAASSCAGIVHNCAPERFQTCTLLDESLGTFECGCREGTIPDPRDSTQCRVVLEEGRDECALGLHQCSAFATCRDQDEG